MKTRSFLPTVAVLCAAVALSPEAFAQSTNVKTPNKNQSTKFKSGIFKGSGNLIQSNSIASFIGGGQSNTVSTGSTNAVIGGGFGNTAGNQFSTVGGGLRNIASASGSTVAGGFQNKATNNSSSVAGGESNTAGNYAATVAGGAFNEATGDSSTVGGGFENVSSGADGTIAGGSTNKNAGAGAFIGGGLNNTIATAASNSVIGGGRNNTNNGIGATIPGGILNKANGNNSFAAGATAQADHNSSFVWSDGSTLTPSFGTNTFTVRATGGAKFFTTTGSQLTSPGPSLAAGGADWDANSDRNLKSEVTAIDHRAVLAKLADMPVTSWRFKHDKVRRYIGPMAQDFHAVFGLGSSDKTIGTLDANGVLFSSVKGLLEELQERDKTIEELKVKNSELSRSIEAINERLDSLPPAP